MLVKSSLGHVAASLLLFTPVLGQTVVGSDYNKPSAGPPASFFAAATTMPVAALQSAAAKASAVPKSAKYPINFDSDSPTATIHADWATLPTGAAYVWVADMDVDCDGLDYQCKGNGDGQDATNFGALAAYEVPFIVIPQHFYKAYESQLTGNNVAAVICNGKMYYGIFGDTDGDTPEVIGEASWLMARTCFPDDDLNGNNGHVPANVTYIVFTGDNAVLPSSAVNDNYITNFTKLRSLGDSLVNALVSQLGLSGSKPTTTLKTTTTTKTTTTATSTATCSWAGHCLGTSCSSDNECSDPFACINGVCNYDPTETCQWEGHCLASSCSSDSQCSDPWACIDGACAVDPSITCSWEGHCQGATCLTDDECDDPWSCVYGVCATDPSS